MWIRKTSRHSRAAPLLATLLFCATPGAGFEVIEPTNARSVELVVGTGQLIRVEEPFASLFVADPDVADVEVKSPRLLYLTGIGVGETTLFAVDADDDVLMSANIKVTHNARALRQGFGKVAPGQKVSATTVNQSLVVTGEVTSPEQAANVLNVANQFVDDPAQIVNRMSISEPTQVNLQVRIAEVNRSIDRQLGIQWSAANINAGGARLSFVGGGIDSTGGYGVGGSYSGGSGWSIDVLLRALSEEGLVTLLAEPNLTARSGESAEFLAGGEYPYAIENDGDVSIAFKNYGVELDFVPTVLDGDRINLAIGTSVSDLDFSKSVSGSIPALTTRRAQTTVDLASGQSFAIAGLMQNTTSQDDSRMPGLGSLPVIGALFKSSGFRRGQTELVIIVTPIIVKPTSAKRLRTPLDNYIAPNDFERVLLGRFQGQPDRTGVIGKRYTNRRLHGQAGFVFR